MKNIQRLLILALIVASCTSKKNIDSATALEVVFFNNGDTLRYGSADDTLLKHFREVLDGRVGQLPICKGVGQVNFYKNDELVYAVGVTETNNECSHLFVGTRSWKMTYNIGMYLSELYNNLKEENE
jgi:hypothetical protein